MTLEIAVRIVHSMNAMDQGAVEGQQDNPKILLAVLNAIDRHESPSQRSIASDVGIALGMANAYVKRCVKKVM